MLAKRIADYLASQPDLSRVRQEPVAEFFGMHRNTMSNRLAKEQTSFQRLITAERRRRAEAYLASDEPVYLKCLAVVIGYSSESYAYKFLRKWGVESIKRFKG